ncbi:hypothetical protein KQI88_01660 [Alkaliphilus sp. MSJ-5]|uniref:ABC-2 family transporter protein n=1 Tax=Alkaliphilus flagellatus TaxID=2841507 RepID=A0ABS6G092_9FIRM|nr:hypothetical protein [Alkaliphilus flagellatus]MBU5675122.1 hypothetical protein [Alkaliphilus flagellatus]
MNSILKVTKYQLHDFKKSVAIFYTVIFLLSSVIGISIDKITGTFGGFGLTTAIFIFIAGLNCFKSNFKFMMANNVSRKRFYYGNIIALVIIAAFMALVDSILSYVLNLIIPYESVIVQLYNKKNFIFFDEFLWSFGLYTLFVCLGWLITMLYYRCNKIMKTIISIIPIPIIILLQYVEQESGGAVGRTIMGFLDKALGFAYNNNTYIGTLSFLAGTAALLPICFLLIRKAPIKD